MLFDVLISQYKQKLHKYIYIYKFKFKLRLKFWLSFSFLLIRIGLSSYLSQALPACCAVRPAPGAFNRLQYAFAVDYVEALGGRCSYLEYIPTFELTDVFQQMIAAWPNNAFQRLQDAATHEVLV